MANSRTSLKRLNAGLMLSTGELLPKILPYKTAFILLMNATSDISLPVYRKARNH